MQQVCKRGKVTAGVGGSAARVGAAGVGAARVGAVGVGSLLVQESQGRSNIF